jgi:hypothetical protein
MLDAELMPEFPPIGLEDASIVDTIMQHWGQGVVPADVSIFNGVDSGVRLLSLGTVHKRSLELAKDDVPAGLGDVSVKGTRLRDPRLKCVGKWHSKYNDFIGGMLLRDAASAHLGSTLMHERGIDFGERVLAVMRLKTMPDDAGSIKPVAEAMHSYPKDLMPLVGTFRFDSPSMQPVAVVRSMPNAYRLWDLSRNLSWAVGPILERSIRVTALQAPLLVDDLDPTDFEDQLKYLEKRVPLITGYAFGRLRAAGLEQRYPHAGNMSLSLGLPDTDGIRPFLPGPSQRLARKAVKHCTETISFVADVARGFDKKHCGMDAEQKACIKHLYQAGFKVGTKEQHIHRL